MLNTSDPFSGRCGSWQTDRALLFAYSAHAATGRRRRYTNELWIRYLAEVAADVARLLDVKPATIAAAWLHDIVMNTAIPPAAIDQQFGPLVARLVDKLTVDDSLPAPRRRALRRRRLETVS